jgi:hypothetical protein
MLVYWSADQYILRVNRSEEELLAMLSQCRSTSMSTDGLNDADENVQLVVPLVA